MGRHLQGLLLCPPSISLSLSVHVRVSQGQSQLQKQDTAKRSQGLNEDKYQECVLEVGEEGLRVRSGGLSRLADRSSEGLHCSTSPHSRL